MTDNKSIDQDKVPTSMDQLVTKYLSENPQLAAALVTFEVAQEEYRKSLMALTSVRVVTSGTANIEA
jgi:hypothetical protein